jgi:hypothetical protein
MTAIYSFRSCAKYRLEKYLYIVTGFYKVKLINLENLSKKIEVVIEQYDIIKKDKQRIEAQMLKKDKETQEIRMKLEKVLRERNIIKKKLDSITEKINSLNLF